MPEHPTLPTKPHAHRQLKQHTSPDGGIGRRAGLKHQWSNPCRFDPGSGYPTKCKCLIFKHLHFSFSLLHHACTTEWAVLGQNYVFLKIFLYVLEQLSKTRMRKIQTPLRRPVHSMFKQMYHSHAIIPCRCL